MSAVDFKKIERLLGYEFKNQALLKQALTHRSANKENNERLEFLGDSILSMVISTELYQRFPHESEGQLSRLRAFLVKGDMLAELASGLKLGDFLFLGQGELKSGGYRRASILADTLEALIAAIFLDSGILESQQFILRMYASQLADEGLNNGLKDSKTQLQELLQAQKKALPRYTLTHIEGDEHNQTFHVTCSIDGFKEVTKGSGSNRRKAEQIAASLYLDILTSL